MNCQEVQAWLSDYLEQSLDAANLEIIENHLSLCPFCRAEADHLKECIRYIATLPSVDPPIGFTQRVMAQAREIEMQPSLWERLLFPLRIKIPIQATAVVMIGILAIYLLNKEPPDKQGFITSEATVSKKPLLRIEQGNGSPESSAEVQQPPANSNRLADTRAPSSAAPVSKTAQTRAAGGAQEPVSADRAKSLTEEPSDSNSPSLSPVEPRGRAIIAGTPVTNSVFGSGQVPSEFESGFLRSGSVSIEPFADYEMVFRLHPQLQDQARRDNPNLSQKAGARAVAERQGAAGVLDRLLESVGDGTRPQTVWLSVSKSQYEQWKKELRAVGTIESETQIPLLRAEPGAQTNGQLQIKLTVFPATEANRATPSSPNDR